MFTLMFVLTVVYFTVAGILFTFAMALGGGMYGSGPRWWEALGLAVFWPLLLAAAIVIIPAEKIMEKRRSRRHGR